jgi:hypothetical protein
LTYKRAYLAKANFYYSIILVATKSRTLGFTDAVSRNTEGAGIAYTRYGG